MEEVLKQAQQLAQAILESNEYVNMRACEQVALHDEGAAKLIADYTEKRTAVENTLAQNDMDHDQLAAAGRELEEAEQRIDAYPILKDMRAARETFNGMMKHVNALIKLVVTGEMEDEGGCSGDCGSCHGGCH